MAKITWKKVLAGGAALTGGSLLLCLGIFGPCWRSWLLDGIVVGQCPTGEVRPTLSAHTWNLGRDRGGTLTLSATGNYVVGKQNHILTAPIRRFTPQISLIAPDGTSHPIEITKKGWVSDDYYNQTARIKLPKVPDGDYKLHITTDTPAGTTTLDLPTPLYTPAHVHILTDSPLYKPGQTLQFRAIALAQTNLSPLNNRPGTWKVYDPEGELLLEEKASTGNFGVTASNLPLDSNAPSGRYRVRYETGANSDEVTIEVKPFTLPRFTLQTTPSQRAYLPGDTVLLNGTLQYTSGAPIPSAPITVTLQSSTDWPLPTDWQASHLLTTDKNGTWNLNLGSLPADLTEPTTLQVSIQATDPTGETQYSNASLTLSPDPIQAEAVTELGDGLVPSNNNRVYIRVTHADGRVLANSSILVKKAWDPGDPGITTPTDKDGVARIQLDPGEPVTLVKPAQPRRKKPATQTSPVQLASATDAFTSNSLDTNDQTSMDRWKIALAPCAALSDPGGSPGSLQGAILIDANGAIRRTTFTGDTPRIATCAQRAMEGQRAYPGSQRLLHVSFDLEDPKTPALEWSPTTTLGDLDVDEPLNTALAYARSCAQDATESGDLGQHFTLSATPGSRKLSLDTLKNPDGSQADTLTACVSRAISGLELSEPAEDPGMVAFSVSVQVFSDPQDAPPQPTTWQGFSYTITALQDREKIGSTHLNLKPGTIPDLRLRFSEVLVNPGDTVELLALRGPNFSGYFPEKLGLNQGSKQLIAFDFDPKRRTGSFKIPDDVSGFATVEWSGAKAVLYVRPKATLNIALSTESTEVKPGQTIALNIQTNGTSGPIPAGLTLSGVDSTLATLAKLPSPEEFARITVQAQSSNPAFGILDARALQTGQIAGDNAAQATILRISELPPGPPGAESLSLSGSSILSIDGEYADNFYAFYEEVRAVVRKWETDAPEGEVMTPKKAVELWEQALKAHPATDPWGRSMHLSVLPNDFLILTDPRMMVADGTRLPEDIENWTNYVRREAP